MIKDLLKKTVKTLAVEAVDYAESILGSGMGESKKEMAINFIIDKLPLPGFIARLLGKFLSDLIDESIELAVKALKEKEAV